MTRGKPNTKQTRISDRNALSRSSRRIESFRSTILRRGISDRVGDGKEWRKKLFKGRERTGLTSSSEMDGVGQPASNPKRGLGVRERRRQITKRFVREKKAGQQTLGEGTDQTRERGYQTVKDVVFYKKERE